VARFVAISNTVDYFFISEDDCGCISGRLEICAIDKIKLISNAVFCTSHLRWSIDYSYV
jgi:hypothetical protein